jgi:hypothetical protein
LKTYLKNKRAYARKRGYLTENTNQKQGRHENDEDEDDEDDDEDEDDDDEGKEGKGKERERDMVVEKEQAKDGWNRGNGWGADFKGSDEDDDDLV